MGLDESSLLAQRSRPPGSSCASTFSCGRWPALPLPLGLSDPTSAAEALALKTHPRISP